MFSESIIDAATVQAYLGTHYLVHAQPDINLRIGQHNTRLLTLHQQHQTDCSAFLTACNPHSQRSDDDSNARRQADLALELRQRNLSFLPGTGQHPSNNWPGEASFLVLGLTLEAAKTLGNRLQQNAFVWCGSDAVAQLILLR